MKKFSTSNAPAAIGPYSQAILVNGFLYISGQIPIVPESGKIIEGGIVEQTEQVIKNIHAILKNANTDFDRVFKTTCFLKSMEDFAEFNKIYEQYFIEKPVRSCVEVSALPKNALVEIEVIAVIHS